VPVMEKNGRPTLVCHDCGLFKIRLFKVSRILLKTIIDKKTQSVMVCKQRHGVCTKG
jgi:hypothetical protein